MQTKAYARSNGSDHEKQNSDRSTISVIPKGNTSPYVCRQVHQCTLLSYSTYKVSVNIALNLMMGIILLTNILLFILTLQYFRAVSKWIHRNEYTKKFYKASTVVIVLLNCISFLFDSYIISIASYDNTTQIIGLVFKLSSLALIPALEFVWISINVYTTFHPQKGNCALLSFGFCQVLWFAHRLLIDMIMSAIFFHYCPCSNHWNNYTSFVHNILCNCLYQPIAQYKMST